MTFSDLHYVCHMYINTLIVHTSYTEQHNHCIMTMTQYITLLYVLTLSLLSTVAPLDNNNSTTLYCPDCAALCSGVSSFHYNDNIMSKLCIKGQHYTHTQ